MQRFLDGGFPAMQQLKDEGAIDAIGIGVNETAVCELLLDRIELDFILLAGRYTLLDQSAEALLSDCISKGVRIIVGGPFNSGILAQPLKDQPTPRFDYERASPEIMRRAKALEELCVSFGVPLAAAALHFPLRHPAVAAVIPGPSSPIEVEQLLRRSETVIPEELWIALEDRGLLSSGNGGAPDGFGQPQLMLLDEEDTIMVCISPVSAGDVLLIDGQSIVASEAIMVGHKIARRRLVPGERVIKYGAPIGSITSPIEAGAWVHLHNMKSDYLAAHMRENVGEER
jgi:D-threo-aldose 1-dehydrogenase